MKKVSLLLFFLIIKLKLKRNKGIENLMKDNQKYSVILETFLGIKKGELKISQNQSNITGYLSILNHCLPIKGKIDTDGRCNFTGSYITLLRKVNFQAVGSVSENYVDFILSDPKNTFRLAGIAKNLVI